MARFVIPLAVAITLLVALIGESEAKGYCVGTQLMCSAMDRMTGQCPSKQINLLNCLDIRTRETVSINSCQFFYPLYFLDPDPCKAAGNLQHILYLKVQ